MTQQRFLCLWVEGQGAGLADLFRVYDVMENLMLCSWGRRLSFIVVAGLLG